MIQDSDFARKQIVGPVIAEKAVKLMENWRLSTNAKLIISSFAIVGLLIFSGFLANTVQSTSAERATATVAQNHLNMMVLTIKADIAESMLPAHDYLIQPNPDEQKEFLEFKARIDKAFEKMSQEQHFEAIDHKIIDDAYGQFKKLEKIQAKIFNLKGGQIEADGPEKMEEMHVYQHAILDKLGTLNDLEEAELASLIRNEQDTNRRSVLLIAAAAALALGGALLVGYLSSQS